MDGSVPEIERAATDAIEPESLAAVRRFVCAAVGDVVETRDRRGFRLLQWAPIRPNSAGKPVELSLEHEARLRPRSDQGIRALQKHLSAREGSGLLDAPGCATLMVRRLQREPGSQSIDRYWDRDGTLVGGWIGSMRTFRQRMKASSFMTWAGGVSSSAETAFNLELPPVAIGDAGVIARLEFNWIDALPDCVAEITDIGLTGHGIGGHPLVLALGGQSLLPPGRLQPALEHTTFREKYVLTDGQHAAKRDLFHLNIDHMSVQSLSSGHFAHHCDVDIAPATPVDASVLEMLTDVVGVLSREFDLAPALATKAWWGARILGELP